MQDNNLLFNEWRLSDVIRNQELQMHKAIDVFDGSRLLNTSPDDLVDYFVKIYEIEPVNILDDNISIDQEECQIDVSGDRRRDIRNRSGPTYITGTKVTLFVPFHGETDMFKCQPSTFTLSPPRGRIADTVLELNCYLTEHDKEGAKEELHSSLSSVKQYLNHIESDLEPFNSGLREKALSKINIRRDKLLDDQNLAANLGFPLRKRDDSPTVYTSPEVRRKAVRPPAASTAPYEPEPQLVSQDYENILQIISQTAKMLERSPKTFANMEEEQLRDQFLVPLNSHYEGQTTGETFNAKGKTDILVRDKDKPIFIAECKIWKGPKSLLDAIDQLLSYTTWRDTKTAIMIFNRNKNFSEVIGKINETVQSHNQYKRDQAFSHETGFRAIISHPSDVNRELVLTVLAFDVPK